MLGKLQHFEKSSVFSQGDFCPRPIAVTVRQGGSFLCLAMEFEELGR